MNIFNRCMSTSLSADHPAGKQRDKFMVQDAAPTRKGWLVVCGLLLVMTICHGIITSGLPALDKALLADLDISRADLKLRETIFLLASGVSGLGIGLIASRIAPRFIVVAGLLLLSAVLAAYGHARTIGEIYLLYALLGLCFASAHVVIIVLMIRQWFDKRRALAISVALSGTSIGAAIFPSVTTWALQTHDWRQVLSGMAILPLIVVLPVAFLLRGQPRSDDAVSATSGGQTAGVSRPGKGPVLLLLTAIFAIFFSSTAFLLNLFLYLQDIGLSPQATASGVSLVFVIGLLGKVLVGMAAERWGTYSVWTVKQCVLLAGAVVLSLANPALAFVGLALLGLGWAGCYVLTQVVISDIFAGPSLGRIAGMFIVFEALASGSGVWVAAAMSDYFGSYREAFLLCCGLLSIAIIATLLFRRSLPVRQPAYQAACQAV